MVQFVVPAAFGDAGKRQLDQMFAQYGWTNEQADGRECLIYYIAQSPDARHLLNGFEKIANRVTTGIILAALIVGAALMMKVNSTFQIAGYPGIAMICFLVAIAGSGLLILSILWKDYQDKRKARKP